MTCYQEADKMPKIPRILVIGDGTAGLNFANKIRRLLPADDAFVTLVGSSSRHYYKGDGFLLPFGYKKPYESYKPVDFLLDSRVEHIRDTVTGIRVNDRAVITRKRTLNYDYLVIATGAKLAYEMVPGYLGEAKHFYDFEHSMELRGILERFNGGNVVIGPCEVNSPCPPSSFEFAVLLDQFLRDKGIRDKTSIKYVYPLEKAFLLDELAPTIEQILRDNEIEIVTGFEVDSVIQKNHELHSKKGDSINYDLLILVPPHRGQDFIAESGLKNVNNFVTVDKDRLNPEGHDEIFVIGDAADLPIPKAASAAWMQAEYVAKEISHRLGKMMIGSTYEGEVGCTLYTGRGMGMTVYFNYEKRPVASKPKRFDYLLKKMECDAYFSAIARGMI